VIAVSEPVADTPLVIEVRCTGAVFGRGGAVVVVHATTPLATSRMATTPRAARNATGSANGRRSDPVPLAAAPDASTPARSSPRSTT
jgi:hypothetical protein